MLLLQLGYVDISLLEHKHVYTSSSLLLPSSFSVSYSVHVKKVIICSLFLLLRFAECHFPALQAAVSFHLFHC